jgi:outer membrane lipoprotein carrier protein
MDIPPMRFAARLILLLAAALPTAAVADARAQLDAFARGLDGLSGRFEQTVHDPGGKPLETSTGTLALKAPRQFRWVYEAPYAQVIVADGLNVWVHDVDLEQVTVRAQSSAESQSPLTVLTDLSLLDRDFKVSARPDADGLQWLRLESKAEEPAFKSCDLGFAGNALVQMVLVDHLGQVNRIRFEGWQRNPAFAADAFSFTVPEGADLVGEPVEGAEAFPVRD